MDLPVVLIKFRDYIFWFGPAYLAAIAFGAAMEVIRRRVLKLPLFTCFAGGRELPVDSGLLYSIWWQAMGRPNTPLHMRLPLYAWLGVTSQALSWTALLLTAALSPGLSVFRLGCVLLIASLLATVMQLFLKPGGRVTWVAIQSAAPAPPLLKEWRQVLSHRFSASSNSLILAAALGAGVIGLAPDMYHLLQNGFAWPFGYVAGPGLGLVLGVFARAAPGCDGPLLAALGTRGVERWAVVAVMLAVSSSSASLVKGIDTGFGKRAAATFLLLVWLLAGALALLPGPAV